MSRTLKFSYADLHASALQEFCDAHVFVFITFGYRVRPRIKLYRKVGELLPKLVLGPEVPPDRHPERQRVYHTPAQPDLQSFCPTQQTLASPMDDASPEAADCEIPAKLGQELAAASDTHTTMW